MAKNKNLENGSLTNPMNTENRAFQELEQFLSLKANALSSKSRLNMELFGMKIKIEDYLNATNDEIVTVGDFLRLYIDKLNLKQNKLAKYIGLNPTNFNKILSGNRKVNFELSYALSQIFDLPPATWILIQVKNEYAALEKNKGEYFQKFNLEDLISA